MDEETRTPDEPELPDPVSDTEEEDPEDFLLLQSKKAELIQIRDSLAQKKSELTHSIERLSMSLSDYEKQQVQLETKQKLEYYLHQSDHETSKLSQLDEAASFILKNMHVLPTTDINLRMELIDKFYPYMSVAQEYALTKHEENVLFTVIGFEISSKGLPPLLILLFFNDETIRRVEMLNLIEVVPIFQKISPSFCDVLTKNYCKLQKIDMILYSYHSLSRLQQARVECLSQILLKYASFVTRPTEWVSSQSQSLTSINQIELTIPSSNKIGTHKVKLQWDMLLENTVIGEVESNLCFSVQRQDIGPLKNANDVFLSLSQKHGISEAFSLMLFNLFDV